MKKTLPIGIDSFREIREDGRYYADKTLFIRDFIRAYEKVTLVTRPRRFGKTLNMTTLREFFDITIDSKAIFSGLEIMNTEYAAQMNSRPVIFFSFKDCKANEADDLIFLISNTVLSEYRKYCKIFRAKIDETNDDYLTFFLIYDKLINHAIDLKFLMIAITTLEQALYEYYKIKPLLLIDEYDQPILSSFEHGYHSHLKEFFAGFYGAALKGQDCLHQALLTGIQRIAKESIFSQLNNVKVYTVLDKRYSEYFGFTSQETDDLLAYYGFELNDNVKQKYDGYIFGETEMYNPWSLLCYADSGALKNYWINTSTNLLIRDSIREADHIFMKSFEKLISEGSAEVAANLECSFIELKQRYTLWGLLINSGYLTVIGQAYEQFLTVRIPNGEVRSEFASIVAEHANVSGEGLQEMFRRLLDGDMEGFIGIYRELVISCTSYFDAKENAYHMLFLGMCITLNNLYKITSNIESGHGRSDITMESLSAVRPHVLIEFKQGEAIGELKEQALRQIHDNEYYAGLHGKVLCIGIAHDKKRCDVAYEWYNDGA